MTDTKKTAGSRLMHVPIVFFAAAILCLAGCGQTTTNQNSGVKDNTKSQLDKSIEEALNASSPEVKDAFAAASSAALEEAATKVATVVPKNKNEEMAVTDARTKVIERATAKETRPAEAAAAFEQLAKSAPDEVKPIYEAAADRTATPTSKVAAFKTVLQNAKKLAGDPELEKMVGELKDITKQISKSKEGPGRKALIQKLDTKSKEFDKQTKVVAKKGEWDKIAGPAMAAAEVMVEAAELSETWEDRSDAEKVAGVCGVLGSACLTVAPFLPPPANAIVAAVGAVLKIMEFIIPKLFSGGGDGGSGGNKSSKADGKNAGPGKPGNPKKPDPKGNDAGHSVTAAAVAGAYADGKGDPQKTAQGVGQRLGLNAEQTKRLEGAYAKAMKETPSSSTPQQKLDALTDATTKEVPESKAGRGERPPGEEPGRCDQDGTGEKARRETRRPPA